MINFLFKKIKSTKTDKYLKNHIIAQHWYFFGETKELINN
jgi:hypothetical protein